VCARGKGSAAVGDWGTAEWGAREGGEAEKRGARGAKPRPAAGGAAHSPGHGGGVPCAQVAVEAGRAIKHVGHAAGGRRGGEGEAGGGEQGERAAEGSKGGGVGGVRVWVCEWVGGWVGCVCVWCYPGHVRDIIVTFA
jgi:hypothetical protein